MTEGLMTIKVQPLHIQCIKENPFSLHFVIPLSEQLVQKKFIHLLISQAVLHLENMYPIYWCENILVIVYSDLYSAFYFWFRIFSSIAYEEFPLYWFIPINMLLLFYSDIFAINFNKLYGRCCILYIKMLNKFGLPVFAR